ncbi:hypothetical protein ANN_20652 [Periplaneta americana]|uniref:Uncharacterized protein n=1 Tax=Periplaneta americana TaxID=6978 RepID=A0ABQ8SDN1_PERAM|nr:hypothetical protein ANN_20652 [Periplaneta americana]
MSPESSTESYPAFACIGLRENPGKNLNQVTCPERDSNPCHLILRPDVLTNQSDSLMAADGDYHRLCKLMAPVRHRWSINDVIGGIRNTVMPSDCSQNTPVLWMIMVCAMEVPCMPSLNMNDAFRTEGYHIKEYLLSMGLGERLGIAKERGNERSAHRPYFGCGIKTTTCNSPERPARFTPQHNSALKLEEVPLKTRENIDPDFQNISEARALTNYEMVEANRRALHPDDDRKRVDEERMMLKLIGKRKGNWLGHWLRRNCLLKDALDGMVNGRRVRSRRRYQMIDDIKIYTYESYEETKRKAESRKDWGMLGLQ